MRLRGIGARHEAQGAVCPTPAKLSVIYGYVQSTNADRSDAYDN